MAAISTAHSTQHSYQHSQSLSTQHSPPALGSQHSAGHQHTGGRQHSHTAQLAAALGCAQLLLLARICHTHNTHHQPGRGCGHSTLSCTITEKAPTSFRITSPTTTPSLAHPSLPQLVHNCDSACASMVVARGWGWREAPVRGSAIVNTLLTPDKCLA